MSRIHGLFSKKKEDDKKNEEFVVGGAQSSTAVMRPVKDNNEDDEEDLMRSIVNEARAQSHGPRSEGPTMRITLYKNGFLVGDKKFYPLTEEKNVLALKEIKEGRVPNMLEQDIIAAHGPAVAEVGVELANKASETYTPPKQPFSFAESRGQVLAAATTGPASSLGLLPAQEHTPASSSPVAIMLTTHDRRRVRLAVDAAITVAALYQHVKALTGCSNFELLAGFPPKPLVDGQQTVGDAKLGGSQITQRAL